MDTRHLTENFAKRRITVKTFHSFQQIKYYLLATIPLTSTVGIGNSQTLKGFGITQALQQRGHIVYDKTLATTPAQITDMKKKSLLADCYISSANAISQDGRIINIDHSGNRVAAIAYGPDKVYIVVGKNKITPTYTEALHRARHTAAPLNAKRAGYHPPCLATGHCVDCLSPERVCHHVSITEGQHIPNRLELLIASEDAGF